MHTIYFHYIHPASLLDSSQIHPLSQLASKFLSGFWGFFVFVLFCLFYSPLSLVYYAYILMVIEPSNGV